MAFIFSASTDVLSAPRTSRIIGPILRWFKPDLSNATIYRVQYGVRKTGHVTEYAVLAMLLWRALRQPKTNESPFWRWSAAGVALVVAALYAGSDEWHQSLVPSRDGRVGDVLLDTCGAAAGLGLLWAYGRRRDRG